MYTASATSYVNFKCTVLYTSQSSLFYVKSFDKVYGYWYAKRNSIWANYLLNIS